MDESNINEFRIIDKLGEGSFADVYKVKSIKDQKIYAEKRLKKRYRSLEEVRNLTEVSALRLLSRHPNIITLHSIMYDSQTGHVALIFEQMEMNLYNFILKRKDPESPQFDEFTALLLMYQLTKAISYVHSCGIFHRDIKPENCLINSESLELKLSDFGSVSPIANRTKFTEYVATRWYRAPECIITTGAYGPPVDIWAIGCVFYELLTMRPLFPGKHQLDQLNKIHSILGSPSHDYMDKFQSKNENEIQGEVKPKCDLRFVFPIQKQKHPFESLLPNTSPEIVDLIKKMITYDPDDRITAADALCHPAFQFLYSLDMEWQKTSRTIPFSVFAMKSRGCMNLPPIQLQEQPPQNILSPSDVSNSSNANDQINPSLSNSSDLYQSIENSNTFSNTNINSTSKSSLSEPNANVTNIGKPPAPLIGMKQSKQNPSITSLSGTQMNTLEARKIAAQRFVDYHKRQIISKTRLQMHPSQHQQQNITKKKTDSPSIAQTASVGNISSITLPQQQQQTNANGKLPKPIIHYSTSIYQKPRPEMIQPRLPSISYKPLKRP